MRVHQTPPEVSLAQLGDDGAAEAIAVVVQLGDADRLPLLPITPIRCDSLDAPILAL